MKILLVIALLFFSPMSYAERIIIMGDPIVLEERNDLYFLPAYMPTTPYTFVTIRGIPRVCYPERQPYLAHLDTLIINVEVEDEMIAEWNCYIYNATYFETRP